MSSTERPVAGEETRPMNVHPLTRQKSGCTPASSVVDRLDGAFWAVQGACAVAKSPLGSDADDSDETFVATFRADTATIPPVRLELQNWLSTVGLQGVVGDVALVCDELMANAAVHGCRGLPPDTELSVTVKRCVGRLRVIVSDPSSEKPREQSDSDSRPSGRGLKLVGAFSERWGVDEAPGRLGKTVWADVHAPRRQAS